MPRLTRRLTSRRQDVVEITEEQERHLTKGYSFFPEMLDEASFRLAWEEHGERLLAEFIEDHPGRRPFGWYFCDHQRERPITNPWFTPQVIAAKRAEPGHFGFLHTAIYGGPGFEPLQEDETDYLLRMKILSNTEMKALNNFSDDD